MPENEVQPRFGKCQLSRKVIFPTKLEAAYRLLWLRWVFKHPPKRPDGSRVKRRMRKKPAQRRIYFCEYCQGYHLTRMTIDMYEQKEYTKKKWK